MHIDKSVWKDFLIFVEQERGDIHPVAYELIGQARKLAAKLDFKVHCVLIGGAGTKENAKKLLAYGIDTAYVYEDEAFEDFRCDNYANAFADIILRIQPSSVLVGATALGRSLAPRVATRFKTGLTADCTKLDIQDNTDMIQIRPAFGGNIMAQIAITETRPQFATVRCRVMDRAQKVDKPWGVIKECQVIEDMAQSDIEVLSSTLLEKGKNIEDEDILVVAGRGIGNDKGVGLAKKLADVLGGQVAFTRPMVEQGFGDTTHQIGLSGRTVRPKLLITCGVSGAIQFTSCMNQSECIIAIDTNPDAQIFQVAHYCIQADAYQMLSKLIQRLEERSVEDGLSL